MKYDEFDQLELSREKNNACRDLLNHTVPTTAVECTLLLALRHQIKRADRYKTKIQDILEELD
jgi:hypothetical protein